MILRKLAKDTDGAAMVEFTIILTLFVIFLLGSVDFFLAYYQWNRVTKAVERGARIAVVSTPVDNGIRTVTDAISGLQPGDPVPANYFVSTCEGGACTGTRAASYNANAMNLIVFGRDASQTCTDATSVYKIGMCDIYDKITPANVTVEYRYTGLGFVGRPGGAVPTVKVSVRNLTFDFVFLKHLFGQIQMPSISATATGEDLFSSKPVS